MGRSMTIKNQKEREVCDWSRVLIFIHHKSAYEFDKQVLYRHKGIPERCFPQLPTNVRCRCGDRIFRDCIYSKGKKSFCKQKKQSHKTKKRMFAFFGTQGILLGPLNASYTFCLLYYSKLTKVVELPQWAACILFERHKVTRQFFFNMWTNFTSRYQLPTSFHRTNSGNHWRLLYF